MYMLTCTFRVYRLHVSRLQPCLTCTGSTCHYVSPAASHCAGLTVQFHQFELCFTGVKYLCFTAPSFHTQINSFMHDVQVSRLTDFCTGFTNLFNMFHCFTCTYMFHLHNGFTNICFTCFIVSPFHLTVQVSVRARHQPTASNLTCRCDAVMPGSSSIVKLRREIDERPALCAFNWLTDQLLTQQAGKRSWSGRCFLLNSCGNRRNLSVRSLSAAVLHFARFLH